jgi:hypothetical protein
MFAPGGEYTQPWRRRTFVLPCFFTVAAFHRNRPSVSSGSTTLWLRTGSFFHRPPRGPSLNRDYAPGCRALQINQSENFNQEITATRLFLEQQRLRFDVEGEEDTTTT